MRTRSIEQLVLETTKLDWACDVIPSKIKDFRIKDRSQFSGGFREYGHISLDLSALVMPRQAADGERCIVVAFEMENLVRRVSSRLMTDSALLFAGKSPPGVCEVLVLGDHEVVCAVPLSGRMLLSDDVPDQGIAGD